MNEVTYVRFSESDGEIVVKEVTQQEIAKQRKEEELKQEERRNKYCLPLSKEIKTEILRRCEILQHMGDSSIMPDFYQSSDEQLVEDYSWVLDEEHKDLARPYKITI